MDKLVEILCWGGLAGVIYRCVTHENTPTFESDGDDRRNHLLRVKTGAVFVPFVVASALAVPEVFCIFLLIMTWKGVGEYIEIVIPHRMADGGKNKTIKYEYTVLDRAVQFACILPGIALYFSFLAMGMAIGISFSVLASLYIVLIVKGGKPVDADVFYRFCEYSFAFLWISFPLAHGLAMVRSMRMEGRVYGGAIVVIVLLTSWIGDAAAYYGGKKFGTVKATPNVSPGKSWAGYFAEILCTLVFCLLFKYWQLNGGEWLPPMDVFHYIALALIASLFGIFGDLLESLIKRIGAIKDSGSFFPGHGGILDRFDTFLVCGSPLFYYFVYLVGDGVDSLYN